VEDAPPWVVFFSGEPYSEAKQFSEQMAGQVVRVRFVGEESNGYFGITPLFVKQKMNGKFSKTAIIMMGCDGLKHYWDGTVSAEHADTATIHLLKHLLPERITVAEAIVKTREEAEPDPIFEGQMMFYPIYAAAYTIPEPSKHP